MPPKIKVTKEMVANAAFALVRSQGHESLSARAIAGVLGCSTQPVLYNYKTVAEIRQAAYEIADRFHSSYILPKGNEEDPMLALGLNYVRFGYEEKELFRFLFQTDQFSGMDVNALLDDPNLTPIFSVMAQGLSCELGEAKEMFLTFFCVAHGMASLLANNSMEYNEGHCREMLENVFFGMVAARKGTENEKAL